MLEDFSGIRPISALSSFFQIPEREEDFQQILIEKKTEMGEIEKEIENSPKKELESQNEDKKEEVKVIPGVIYIST